MEECNFLNKYKRKIEITPLLLCNIDKNLGIISIKGDKDRVFQSECEINIVENKLSLCENATLESNNSFINLKKVIGKVLVSGDIEEDIEIYIGRDSGAWYNVNITKDNNNNNIVLIWYYSYNNKNIKLENKYKIEYFTDVSHELRTPLNVILGALQLVDFQRKNGSIIDNNNKLKEYLSVTKLNSLRLLRLVNNIIDITKINSGYNEMDFKLCNIVSYVEDIVNSVTPYMENKKINIVFDTEKEEIITLIDPIKMEKVFLNILSNAIKFTPIGGTISINISVSEEIYISIKDTGIGMSNDEVCTIFERFKQISPCHNKKNEGSGIGLSIAKSIVSKHNGRIKVESKENEGSKFIVNLPICEKELSREDCELYGYSIESIELEFSDICYHK